MKSGLFPRQLPGDFLCSFHPIHLPAVPGKSENFKEQEHPLLGKQMQISGHIAKQKEVLPIVAIDLCIENKNKDCQYHKPVFLRRPYAAFYFALYANDFAFTMG